MLDCLANSVPREPKGNDHSSIRCQEHTPAVAHGNSATAIFNSPKQRLSHH